MKKWIQTCLKIFFIGSAPLVLLPLLLIAINYAEEAFNQWFLKDKIISSTNKRAYDDFSKLEGGRPFKPNLNDVLHIKSRNQEIFLQYSFNTDAYGRRVSSLPKRRKPSRSVLFFGDSFTFGVGSNDNETIPSLLNSIQSDFHAYNYGVYGTGPRELFTLVKHRELRSEVAEPIRFGVYTFIEDHFYRTSSHFSDVYPKLELINDQVVESHTYTPWEKFLQALFQSRILNSLPYPWQKSMLSGNEMLKFCRIISETRSTFEERYPGSEFIILNFEIHKPDNSLTNSLKDCALSLNISVIDSPTVKNTSREDFFENDGHPTPIANRKAAQFLYEYFREKDGLRKAGAGNSRETL